MTFTEMTKIKRFFTRCSAASDGSITVEAAMIFPLLIAICAAAFDYGQYMTLRSRVQSVSYSLTNVLRERSELYNGSEAINQAQLTQLTSLAQTMLGKVQATGLCLTIEMITFKDSEKKVVNTNPVYYGGANKCRQEPTTRLTALTDLSTWSVRERWLPLYQVTLSLPVPDDKVHRLLKGVGALPERIVKSNVAMPR